MLLHHSQTDNLTAPTLPSVWHLMLLHHSQTISLMTQLDVWSGILCFYIILKPLGLRCARVLRLVSYAFTSFSNRGNVSQMNLAVWYLMLLHHSQTCGGDQTKIFLVWYLMLLHHSQTRRI